MCTLKHTILLLAMALLILGCEREGIVKIDDCQEVVQLETQKGSRPFAYLFTTFTCMYDKTTDKRSIIGGLCLARENAVFHSGCVKAAVYKRESDIHCPPHAHAMAPARAMAATHCMKSTISTSPTPSSNIRTVRPPPLTPRHPRHPRPTRRRYAGMKGRRGDAT